MNEPATRTSVSQLPQEWRKKLLEGPAPLLVVSHAGAQFNYIHQCSAAKGIVCADRSRRLLEQSESGNHPYAIEFPAHALAAASPIFKHGFEADTNLLHVALDIGHVLPGYVMCVLDWYGRALKSKTWVEFMPQDASIDGDDKWYRFYCYATMRSLGMDEFVAQLQTFIERILSSIVVDLDAYVHLIRTLPLSDPISQKVVEYTAQQALAQSTVLSESDCRFLTDHFPLFAEAVAKRIELFKLAYRK